MSLVTLILQLLLGSSSTGWLSQLIAFLFSFLKGGAL